MNKMSLDGSEFIVVDALLGYTDSVNGWVPDRTPRDDDVDLWTRIVVEPIANSSAGSKAKERVRAGKR